MSSKSAVRGNSPQLESQDQNAFPCLRDFLFRQVARPATPASEAAQSQDTSLSPVHQSRPLNYPQPSGPTNSNMVQNEDLVHVDSQGGDDNIFSFAEDRHTPTPNTASDKTTNRDLGIQGDTEMTDAEKSPSSSSSSFLSSPSSQKISSMNDILPSDANIANTGAPDKRLSQTSIRADSYLTHQAGALEGTAVNGNQDAGNMVDRRAEDELYRRDDFDSASDISFTLEPEDLSMDDDAELDMRAGEKDHLDSDIDLTSDDKGAEGDDDFTAPSEDGSEELEVATAPRLRTVSQSTGPVPPTASAHTRTLSPVSERAIIAFPELATRGHLSPSGNLEGLKYIDIFALISDPLDYKGSSQRYTFYEQYACHKVNLPQGLHPRFLIEEYPNHLQGDVISWVADLPWPEEYQSRDVLRYLPEDAKPIFRGQEQPHSYLQKRQTGARLRILGRAYAAGILDQDYRVPPSGKLFREYGRNGQEGTLYIERGHQWLRKAGHLERVNAIRNTPQSEIKRWFIRPDPQLLPDRPRDDTSRTGPSARTRSRQAPPQQPQPATPAGHVNAFPRGTSSRATHRNDPLSGVTAVQAQAPDQSSRPTNSYAQAKSSAQDIPGGQNSLLIPPHRSRASNRDRQTKPLGRQLPAALAGAQISSASPIARQVSASAHNLEFVFHRCRARLAAVADSDDSAENSACLALRRPEVEEICKVGPGQLQPLAKQEVTRLIEVTKLGIVQHRAHSGNAITDEDELNRLGRHQVAVRIDGWVSRYHLHRSFWLGTVANEQQDALQHYIPSALIEQFDIMQRMVRAQQDILDDTELNPARAIDLGRQAAVRQLQLLRQWTEELAGEVATLLH